MRMQIKSSILLEHMAAQLTLPKGKEAKLIWPFKKGSCTREQLTKLPIQLKGILNFMISIKI